MARKTGSTCISLVLVLKNIVKNISGVDIVNITAISVEEIVEFLIGAMQKKRKKWIGYLDLFTIYRGGCVVYISQRRVN